MAARAARLSLNWRVALAGALILACGAGCVGPPVGLSPAYEPLPPAARLPVFVADIENLTPSHAPAQIAGATTRMLVELLVRSRRFAPTADPAGAYRLEVVMDLLREQDLHTEVTYGRPDADVFQRLALVGFSFRVVDPGGREVGRGECLGTSKSLEAVVLPLPAAEQVASGGWWATPYGLATRDGLDQLLRWLAEGTLPGATVPAVAR